MIPIDIIRVQESEDEEVEVVQDVEEGIDEWLRPGLSTGEIIK